VFEPVVAYAPDMELIDPVRNWKFPSNSAWVNGDPLVNLYTNGILLFSLPINIKKYNIPTQFLQCLYLLLIVAVPIFGVFPLLFLSFQME